MNTHGFTAGRVSSSSTITCDNSCKWTPVLDAQGECIGFNKICCGCDDNSFCDFPDQTSVAAALPTTDLETPCQPFQPPSSSSSSSAAALAFKSPHSLSEEAVDVDKVVVRLPTVNDPGKWSTSQIPVIGNTMILNDSGWTVVIMKVTGGPNPGIVSPSLTPTDAVFLADKALAAYVVLPEADGVTQWWVTVSERVRVLDKCFAILQTAQWTILFYRDLMPSAVPAAANH